MPDRRVLLIILDGLGYNRERLAALKDEAWESLPSNLSGLLITQAESVLARNPGAVSREPIDLAVDALLPVAAENLPENAGFDDAIFRLQTLEALAAASAGTDVM